MKPKRLSKAKPRRSSSNIISTLPQTIIETILCLLAIEEAARTSILSREWRYKWTTIPKVEFVGSIMSERKTKEKLPSDIASARKNMDDRCKLFNAVHQVLLMRQGPIHEFTFYSDTCSRCFELDQIILHLSRNHAVKILELAFDEVYTLPLCAFSLHQLTDLDLSCVAIFHQPICSGFGSLRCLRLYYVFISTKALVHLLSNCPSLKRLTLLASVGCDDCTFVELFECLPVIEHLTICGENAILKWLVLDSVPKELSTSLIHLKYFCFKEMSLDDDRHLTFLALLIKCSPNLEIIELQAKMNGDEIYSRILEKYSDVWLEHMKKLVIYYFNNSKSSMEFVKFILARSPKLKKVVLICSGVEEGEELEMLKGLLEAPRVSPVKIVVSSWDNNKKKGYVEETLWPLTPQGL